MGKMVNRQAVGTYKGKLHQRKSGSYGKGGIAKGARKGAKPSSEEVPKGKVNDIRCDGEIVQISSLVIDPNNARLHPERNLEAIKKSLALYGQRSPLVVRKQNRMVAAGNGRLEAMKALGWTKCAVSIRPMTDAEFIGFALADNRTAELAKWDFEVVAKMDKLLQELNSSDMVGWSSEELMMLRSIWTPPEVDHGISSVEVYCVKFLGEECLKVREAVKRAKELGLLDQNATEGQCISRVCSEWLNHA